MPFDKIIPHKPSVLPKMESRHRASQWQQSQDRVLRYLKALGMPPVKSLEVAQDIMRRALARADHEDAVNDHPVRIAMGILHQMVAEEHWMRPPHVDRKESSSRSPEEKVSPRFSRSHENSYASHYCNGQLPVIPRIKRGRMVPEIQQHRWFKGLFAFLVTRRAGLRK